MTEATTSLQKAYLAIQKLKKRLEQEQNKAFAPIAIVGMGCRVPQAKNKHEFWQLLLSGKNVISRYPEARWELLKKSAEIIKKDKSHPYWGGYLENISDFDPAFFGISPREALRMDPQQRILLEVTCDAIEDSGISLENITGSNTGIFTSLYASQFGHLQKLDSDLDALFLPTGNAISIAANRLSYLFDLHGPSLVLDTACSSSLVALHLACLNLQNKSCEMAIVNAININFLPSLNLLLAKAKMLSPDGQCKTFDAAANGYVPGEGCGAIVLKPLEQAIKDNDRVYAVICGSGVNQDGKTNGLTAPNGLQQEKLLTSIYKKAQINPADINYIECHGTGTFLGDPIEVEALGSFLNQNRDKACYIGSVKTNIGHLEPAAGVVSIIKTALAIYHNQIPAHLNCHNTNPHLKLDKYNLKIPQETTPWPDTKLKLAGVSGFGFGGTNAHIVLRNFEKNYNQIQKLKTPELFTLSAKNQETLKDTVETWKNFLNEHSDIPLDHICYNLHLRKSHHVDRLVVIANDINDIKTALQSYNYQEKIYIYNDNEEAKILAKQYINGQFNNWQEYEKDRYYDLIDTPLYPWQHKSYWPELQAVTEEVEEYPLKGKIIPSPISDLLFDFKFNVKLLPELQDTYNVLHAGYYIEMLSFAVSQKFNKKSYSVENLVFSKAIMVPMDKTMDVQLVLMPESNSEKYRIKFYSKTNNSQWIENASGVLSLTAIKSATNVDKTDFTDFQDPKHLYERVTSMGMPAGESIRWTERFAIQDKTIFCEFKAPNLENNNFKLNLHPGVIDGCLQPLFKLLPEKINYPYMAGSIEQINIHQFTDAKLFLYGFLKEINDEGKDIVSDCILTNEHNVVIEFKNIHFKQLSSDLNLAKLQEIKNSQIYLENLDENAQRQTISEFLIKQASQILALPAHELKSNVTLQNLGFDSLMMLALAKAIEAGLGITFDMQSLLGDVSLEFLTDSLVKPVTKETTPFAPAKWINYRKSQSQAIFRLFCFPYGGAGATIYRDWQNEMPASIEICPIQLPGREERMDEAPFNDLNSLLENLLFNIQPELNLPFAFYGHSFGVLIAFELTRLLRKKELPQPKHFFASAFPDPQLPTRSLDNLLNDLKNINIDLTKAYNAKIIDALTDKQLHGLPDIFNRNGITEYGDYLVNRHILKVMLPVFVNDMHVIKEYQFLPETPLNLPITVFMGKNDTWVSEDEHLAWRAHTQDVFNFHTFDSGHLFLRDPVIRKSMLKMIAEVLTEADRENA